MALTPETSDAAASAAMKTTMVGAGVLSFGGITANDLAVIVGLVLTVCGFLINLWFQWRRDRRERLEHEARMAERGFYE